MNCVKYLIFFDKEKKGSIEPVQVPMLMRTIGEILSDEQIGQLCVGGSMRLDSLISFF